MQRLQGKVAVVTGASRGGGRGIALVLGAEGATVYVTGRSTEGMPSYKGAVGTIEATAAAVTARGGVGIPVQCDHTVDEEIDALFKRVKQEHDHLDLLVNNAWGGYEHIDTPPHFGQAMFWEQPLWRWDKMFTAGLRSHLVTTRAALPLMMPQRHGLIVNTTTAVGDEYKHNLFYYVVKTAKNRMVEAMAVELRPYNIAVVALAPGLMRWDEDATPPAGDLLESHTAQYTGRAVAALTADPNVLQHSGHLVEVGAVAREYNFTDIDGRYVPPFSELTATDSPE